MNVIEQYISKHGLSQEKFGKLLSVTQGMVWQWCVWLDTRGKRGTRITAERAIEIEVATDREILREQLRPDVFAERAA